MFDNVKSDAGVTSRLPTCREEIYWRRDEIAFFVFGVDVSDALGSVVAELAAT